MGTLLFRFQILPFFDFYEKSVNISFYLIYVIVDDILGYFSIGKGSKCNKNCGKCVRIDKANARTWTFVLCGIEMCILIINAFQNFRYYNVYSWNIFTSTYCGFIIIAVHQYCCWYENQ